MFVLKSGQVIRLIYDLSGKTMTATIVSARTITLNIGEQSRLEVVIDGEMFARMAVARSFPPIAANREKSPVLIVALIHDGDSTPKHSEFN